MRPPSFALALCAAAGCAAHTDLAALGERRVTAGGLLGDMRVLASDDFEGRAPGTRGEERTIEYLTRRYREIGLAPGAANGTFIQEVPLTGVTSRSSLAVVGGTSPLRHRDDFVAWSYQTEPAVHVTGSELVFVGHGVTAPELGWDDFKGVDLRGKTAVFLIGDPPVPDPADAARLDPRVFRGPAMTYYGRWTYKFEAAAAHGAAAALIIHDTAPAGYGWGVVATNDERERFEITGATAAHCPAEGWLHQDRARDLFAAAGQDLDRARAAAVRRDFRPIPLGTRIDLDIQNQSRELRSRNVVGRVNGRDPVGRQEHVLYSAHWDHLGKDPTGAIHNGALDNASGVAWLLAIAEAYVKLPKAPRRSVTFLAVTAEEYGLMGARYYAQHPAVPLERTVANVNMDVMNAWGRTRSLVSLAQGQTTMDGLLAEEAARQGRRVVGNPEPEKGYLYRSDHFELARKGVPVLGFLFPGADYRDRPPEYGEQKRKDYVGRVYHTPRDVVQPDWDLSGAVEDTQLLFRVGLRLAEGTSWPDWLPGTEFHGRRAAPAAPR